jgi:putative hemolysin
MSGVIVEVLIIVLLLAVNGVFAMSELAIVASKRVRLQQRAERGDAGAATALAIAGSPGEFLATVQVGITLVGVIASVYGGATIAEQLALPLAGVPWIGERAEGVALAIVVAGITFASVILGELVPKRLAIGNPERVAAIIARPMRMLSRVASPLVRLLTGSSQAILRLFGMRGVPEPGLTEEEIHAVIEQGAESGVVPEIEHAIVENVFRLGDRHAAAVMTARLDVEWTEVDAGPEEIRAAMTRREWILVCEGDLDHALGTVHASDLLGMCLSQQPVSLRARLRQPLFVPTSTPVFRLLEMFRQPKHDVAIVVDEYGSVAGVASRDNIIAGVLGGAAAPGDAPVIEQQADGSWMADGDADIRDVEEIVDIPHLDADTRRGYRTLAGFIQSSLGRLPGVGDAVRSGQATFRVESMDGRRVAKVHITRDSPPRRRRSSARHTAPDLPTG